MKSIVRSGCLGAALLAGAAMAAPSIPAGIDPKLLKPVPNGTPKIVNQAHSMVVSIGDIKQNLGSGYEIQPLIKASSGDKLCAPALLGDTQDPGQLTLHVSGSLLFAPRPAPGLEVKLCQPSEARCSTLRTEIGSSSQWTAAFVEPLPPRWYLRDSVPVERRYTIEASTTDGQATVSQSLTLVIHPPLRTKIPNLGDVTTSVDPSHSAATVSIRRQVLNVLRDRVVVDPAMGTGASAWTNYPVPGSDWYTDTHVHALTIAPTSIGDRLAAALVSGSGALDTRLRGVPVYVQTEGVGHFAGCKSTVKQSPLADFYRVFYRAQSF